MRRLISNEHGIALVLILWVLALLSVIVGEFCYAMRTEVNITRNFKDQTKAYYIALAGLNLAIRELVKDQFMPRESTPREGQADETPTKPEEAELETKEQQDRVRINMDLPPVSFQGGEFQVKIGNESGKININGAQERLLRMMVEAFDLEAQQKDIIVDSILDWRDENNLHRLNGAEDDYYNSLPEPYDCKDGYFDTVEELMMVRGITKEIFYQGLKGMVTVYPKRNLKTKLVGGLFRPTPKNFDANRVNLNAAPKSVLLALPSMTEVLVQEVIAFRKKSDFKSMNEVSDIVGPDVAKAISPFITLKLSPYYRVWSIGKVEGNRALQGVEALIEINRELKRGFCVVQLRDGLQFTAEERPTTRMK